MSPGEIFTPKAWEDATSVPFTDDLPEESRDRFIWLDGRDNGDELGYVIAWLKYYGRDTGLLDARYEYHYRKTRNWPGKMVLVGKTTYDYRNDEFRHPFLQDTTFPVVVREGRRWHKTPKRWLQNGVVRVMGQLERWEGKEVPREFGCLISNTVFNLKAGDSWAGGERHIWLGPLRVDYYACGYDWSTDTFYPVDEMRRALVTVEEDMVIKLGGREAKGGWVIDRLGQHTQIRIPENLGPPERIRF